MDDRSFALLLLLLSFTSLVLKCHSTSSKDLKTYIVYTGNSMKDEVSLLSLHKNMLQEVSDSNAAPKSVLHHYKRSFGGFSVKLTEEEAERMAGLDGVVSVFPSEKKQLHTTKSWDFIGFPQQVERTNTESNIIIGVIDSGIWPESESFNDKGFGPPPSKWKGTCQTSNFTCNNKIIGAKYYRAAGDGSLENEDLKSPRDSEGHGTHTASTAAGNPVSTASMLGLGQGTTRGGVTSARIAVYKVCWSDGCDDADILAAFDDAIADGIDILSVSLGGSNDQNYFRDPGAIGAFHAMKNGILTVFSAGNSGPTSATVGNLSPWSISVAASTLDRKFVTKVELGDNRTFEGISINTFDLKGELYPIIYAGDAPNTKEGMDGASSRFCYMNTLDPKLVKGKIVLCEGKTKGLGPFEAGAVGFLTQGQNFRDSPFSFPLPGSYLDLKDGASVYDYLNSTRNPTATIFKSEELKDTLAPEVASFSSRGPNIVTPEILKPDLIAPGVNIIASWSPISPASGIDGDKRKLQFNMISGTSMACPHVSGAAGYVKSFHPTWSPAAIRSALMTTAKQLSPMNNRDAEFAYGVGQINPSKAVDPGLVYDVGESDYIRFLCGQGYGSKIFQLITGDNSTCPETTYKTARELNYPSFALEASHSTHNVSGSFYRTVTNVGSPTSTYTANVNAPQGLKIQVNPSVLSFTSLGQKQTFVLTVEGAIDKSIVSASLVWDDGNFQVRSPIVVFDLPIP
ncbi:cucumisin-like [Abrus precatorius]|uniref:Cucumisin-like n=1 Tax=Abrus precatorius TaxID=3816 RepID=A0A8B8MMN5_ABRPR|nr:cucumisin-like [Abrus precatorius]